MIASPGGISHHQEPAVRPPEANASSVMMPQEMLSGSSSPRSDSVVFARIESATVRIAFARMTGCSRTRQGRRYRA